jgi:hypothetical protein
MSNNNYNELNYNSEYDLETVTTSSISGYSSSDEDSDNDEINFKNSKNYSKYKLLVCEIFNKNIHGITRESDPNINGQFIVIEKFKINKNIQINYLFEKINKHCKWANGFYNKHFEKLGDNYITNYSNIIKDSNYIKPEIGEIYYLSGDECVCVIKTFWLKIIQRTWKKIFKIRQQIIKRRFRPDSILYMQITGKWHEECVYMPSIRGMLQI